MKNLDIKSDSNDVQINTKQANTKQKSRSP